MSICWSRLVVVGVVCVAAVPRRAEPPRAAEPAWAQPLLAQAKLTPATARLDPARWKHGGPHPLDTFQRLWNDWRPLGPTGERRARDFVAAAERLDGLVAAAAARIDVKRLPPGRDEPGKRPEAEALARAVAGLHAAVKQPLNADRQKEL